ncbi:hypothetical protein COT48_02110 [Candidatus Woesearchaeota archaeon CG08_land_8_20_14_0_20_47_9]|nr:MAG: hypothetical protein COT48_02110 [Candidatus Woesearchaeota archaeon CG08_land_8_20_14_0_20_47_9]
MTVNKEPGTQEDLGTMLYRTILNLRKEQGASHDCRIECIDHEGVKYDPENVVESGLDVHTDGRYNIRILFIDKTGKPIEGGVITVSRDKKEGVEEIIHQERVEGKDRTRSLKIEEGNVIKFSETGSTGTEYGEGGCQRTCYLSVFSPREYVIKMVTKLFSRDITPYKG